MKKPYLIAELSCNHEGDLHEMFELIDIAKSLKIDCVKIQSYTSDTISSDTKFKNNTMWGNMAIKKLYKMAHTPRDWHNNIVEYCKKIKIDLFTTVYSENDLLFTKKFNFSKYKIASFELSDLSLIKETTKVSKNIMISNGMSYFEEVENAINIIRSNKARPTLLHCNSGYPANFAELDLQTIPFIKKYFNCTIGFSDHTLFENVNSLKNLEPFIAPLSSVYMGAEVIEFHLIKNRSKSKKLFEKKKGGFDWAFSKEPKEIEYLIKAIDEFSYKNFLRDLSKKHLKIFKKMKGSVKLKPSNRELETRKFQPSLWITKNIKAGDKFKFGYGKNKNFDSLRPNDGLPLKFYKYVNGKKSLKDLKTGHPLSWEDIKIN
ncbi:MAG: hypothetical protein CMI90_00080 [Pelagibacteraceae bacterium]|mgnify:CR=1 FL=1|nr:hypothetical protein [Pelagibacteraceae bacterium]